MSINILHRRAGYRTAMHRKLLMNRWFSTGRLLTLPVPRLFGLGPLLLIMVTGCASNGGAIPAPPAIERPEIVSSDGSFILNWDVSPDSQNPRSYQYERYKNGSLENSTVVAVNSFKHYYLTEGSYEFRVRGCGSDEACGAWSSFILNCEEDAGDQYCWQTLEDGNVNKLAGREELEGEQVEVWDSLTSPENSDCKIPLRAIRKAGLSTYRPIVYIHGGGWKSAVLNLRVNGGSMNLYDYKNMYGILPSLLMADDAKPVYDDDGNYVAYSTYLDFTIDKGLLVKLLNEGFMVFDLEHKDINSSDDADNKCQGRWHEVVSSASEVVEELYDANSYSFNLPVARLSNSLPILLGSSSGGHIVHYITTHQPEKVLRTVNLSGPLSWEKYKALRIEGVSKPNQIFEDFLLSAIEDPNTRSILREENSIEDQIDIVELEDPDIQQAIELNSFNKFYNYYTVNTPAVYYVNFAHDFIYDVFGSGDLENSFAQGQLFCSYVAVDDKNYPASLGIFKTQYNSRRLIDCGSGSYLDQFYDDPDEPGDDMALIKAHAAITEAQLKAILDFLRYGEVTAASY